MKLRYSYIVFINCFLAHAVTDAWFYALPPLLPLIILDFKISYFQAGLISACLLFTGAIFQPFMGYASDLLGRRKLLLVLGLTCFTISLASMGMAPNYAFIIFLGLIAGVAGSIYHPLGMAIISGEFTERRGWTLGIHGSGGGLGIFLAPIFFGALGELMGWRGALHYALGPGLAVSIMFWFLVKETKARKDVVNPLILLKKVGKPLIIMTLVLTFSNICYLGVTTFLPTYFVESRGATVLSAGLFSSVLLFMGIISQPISGYLSDRGGRKIFITVPMFLAAIFLILFISTEGIISLIFLPCIGFSMFAIWPAITALAADLTPDRATATGMGILFGVSFGVSTIGPILAGYIIDILSFKGSFMFLALTSVIAGTLSLWLPTSSRKH